MTQAGIDPKVREMAERILASEAACEEAPGALPSAGSRVCAKLAFPLGRLIGTEGYRALLKRSLTLARREAEILVRVRVKPDGSLEGMDNEVEGASVVLVTHMIALLVTFLGESLAKQIVRSGWPEQTERAEYPSGRSNGGRPE